MLGWAMGGQCVFWTAAGRRGCWSAGYRPSRNRGGTNWGGCGKGKGSGIEESGGGHFLFFFCFSSSKFRFMIPFPCFLFSCFFFLFLSNNPNPLFFSLLDLATHEGYHGLDSTTSSWQEQNPHPETCLDLVTSIQRHLCKNRKGVGIVCTRLFQRADFPTLGCSRNPFLPNPPFICPLFSTPFVNYLHSCRTRGNLEWNEWHMEWNLWNRWCSGGWCWVLRLEMRTQHNTTLGLSDG